MKNRKNPRQVGLRKVFDSISEFPAEFDFKIYLRAMQVFLAQHASVARWNNGARGAYFHARLYALREIVSSIPAFLAGRRLLNLRNHYSPRAWPLLQGGMTWMIQQKSAPFQNGSLLWNVFADRDSSNTGNEEQRSRIKQTSLKKPRVHCCIKHITHEAAWP